MWCHLGGLPEMSPFSKETFDVLLGCGVRRAWIDDLGSLVPGLVSASVGEVRLTKKAIREEAERVADLCAELVRVLSTSALYPQVGIFACIASGPSSGPPEAPQLIEELRQVRRAYLACLLVTGDDPTKPQLDLPGGGRPAGPARNVASAVLWRLEHSGVPVVASATSCAVRAVAAVFRDVGLDADAEVQVRDWIKRYPPVKPPT